MRFKEVEADFASDYGEPVLQTNFRSLERFAAKLFTREVFFLFRDVLARSSAMVVTGCKETCTTFIYIVSKYQVPEREWHVSFYLEDNIFKCSCKWMESFGLPCDHILAVLVYVDLAELPNCLVLHRWTKNAKEAICGTSSREHCPDDQVRDPIHCKTKGRGGGSSTTRRKNPRRASHCSLCGEQGHNRKTCLARRHHSDTDAPSQSYHYIHESVAGSGQYDME